jgi:MoaA/NifB/PqqE/SkfB family radical SAM enzyme
VEFKKTKINDLPLEKLKELIAPLDKKTIVVVTGGEPTLREDLPDILRYIRAHGNESDIQTNGFKFGDMEYAKKLAPLIDALTIPVHSSDMNVFDAITRVPGSGEYTIQGLRNLRKLGVRISTQTVINQFNYKTLPETFDLIQKVLPGTGMTLTFPCATEAAYDTKVVPMLRDVRPYVQAVLKKYAYLLHTHYVPRCYSYPYNNIVYFIDKSDDGSVVKPGWDYYNGDWNNIDFGVLRDDIRVKAPSCKECIYNNDCIGVLRNYIQLYSEADKNFDLSKDLIPIKVGYNNGAIQERDKIISLLSEREQSREEIKHVPFLTRVEKEIQPPKEER